MSARFVVVTLLWSAGVTPALIPAVADAQTSEATISGVVTDATEGALPGVTVTAIHGQTASAMLPRPTERASTRCARCRSDHTWSRPSCPDSRDTGGRV